MSRRHHTRGRTAEAPELDITTFLNLMVVLIPFLLISAVFSRVAIMELSVPTSAGGAAATCHSAPRRLYSVRGAPILVLAGRR